MAKKPIISKLKHKEKATNIRSRILRGLETDEPLELDGQEISNEAFKFLLDDGHVYVLYGNHECIINKNHVAHGQYRFGKGYSLWKDGQLVETLDSRHISEEKKSYYAVKHGCQFIYFDRVTELLEGGV